MVDVRLNPPVYIDLQLHLDAMEEHNLLLITSDKFIDDISLTYIKMVPDLHMWVEVLSREMGVLIRHNSPLGSPTQENNPFDLDYISVIVQQDLHFIGAV